MAVRLMIPRPTGSENVDGVEFVNGAGQHYRIHDKPVSTVADEVEIQRLRGVIDCGCNAIHDAVAVSGGDIERIDAIQRRMRREMTVGGG